jgi:hypothetical protein
MQSSQPYWVTLATVFGLGAIVGNLVAFLLNSFAQHRSWTNDNKKAEWRELIDKLNESLSKMASAFLPGTVRVAGFDENSYQTGIREGRWIIESRIFIAESLRKEKVLERFDELARYVVSTDLPRDPTKQIGPSAIEYDRRAVHFREEIIRLARKDLEFRIRWWGVT